MQFLQNVPLTRLNSFGIEVYASYFSSFSDQDQLAALLKVAREQGIPGPAFILGGGSNILFTDDFDGLVLKNEVLGIDQISEDDQYIYVRAGAGENWHQFVLYCIQRNWAGVENLSLIPGNVGAGPIQNIGAYGVELKQVFHELEAFDTRSQKVITFTLNDCEFGYRQSIFKSAYKDRFIILSVVLRLYKTPVFNTSYGAIKEELEKMGVTELSIRAISQAVINIRSSKLPDPAKIGNAGSFFKNPQVSAASFKELKNNFPGIIGYENEDGSVKLAAGWLIEQCGWKGYRRGEVGCSDKQALVLVNYGHATGKEIFDLSQEILQSVLKKFGVQLEREVNMVGTVITRPK